MEYKSLSIRLPIEIYEALQEEAKKQKRSLNKQIWLYLEESIEEDKKTVGHGPVPKYSRAEGRANNTGTEEEII